MSVLEMLSGVVVFLAALVVLFGLAVRFHEFLWNLIFPLPPVTTAFAFKDEVWTVGSQKGAGAAAEDTSIRPWKVEVSDADIEDLKARLRNTRYPPLMSNRNFQYGFNPEYLKKVVDYWLTKYDWRAQEKNLNQYDHFKTTIEGLNIHFVRVQPVKSPKNIRIIPIILLHGWPGSFFELYKLIPLLTKPHLNNDDTYAAFDVIIPSMPGYGFSDAPQRPGLRTQDIARIYGKLMTRLDIDQFFVHGGDIGSAVGRCLAVMYPQRVLGIELTMYSNPIPVAALRSLIVAYTPSWLSGYAPIPEAEKPRLFLNSFLGTVEESAHIHIQNTKPDTVGAAMTSDPAGLAAYILEKFSTWTSIDNIRKPDGGLTEQFLLDDLLTNVMIYWVSNSVTTSFRLYKETFTPKGWEYQKYPVTVPAFLSDFPNEMAGFKAPDAFVKTYFPKLVKISKHATGGHFPAMEQPDVLAENIWSLANTVLSVKV